MKAEQRGSVACKAVESERASEKDCTMSLKVWNQFLTDIKKECLTQNFGTLSKSEFDLLVFHYYLLEKQSNAAGKYVSDYEIGRDLGLTIQRVRSLREREALKWEFRGNWMDSFVDCLKFARCDGDNVKIPVPDVNVIKEIRNYLEMAGLFDDYQLNPKVFQCNLDVLVAICLDFKSSCDDNLCGKILDKLRESTDKKVAHAVKRHVQPVQAYLTETIVKSAYDTIALIPGVGRALGELFAKLVEK